MREDFQQAFREIKASIQIVTDPVTGYVPRAEIDVREQRIVADAKVREGGILSGVRWTVSIIVAVATLALGALSLLAQHKP